MTEKYLRVTMPNGSKWDIPATLIAGNRAKHYTAILIGEEFKFALENNNVLMLWAKNMMDWGDVVLYAQRAPTQEMDWQEGWINGNKEIIER